VINGDSAVGGGCERWSEAEFARLRAHKDPEIDQFVAEFVDRHPDLQNVRDLMPPLIRELREAKQAARGHPVAASDPDAPRLLAAALAAVGSFGDLPAWASDAKHADLLERGQAVFADNGLYQSAALFFAALPLAYADEASAKVLWRVSDLATKNATRRIAETGQMLIDVMGLRGTGSLEPDGPGYTTAVGLRVLHACVRALILEQPEPWNIKRFGSPVNQELLLATLLDFSIVTWEAMEQLGLTLDDADREANLYTWSVFGFLMGVEACRDRPLTLADAECISAHLSRQLETSEDGRRLMKVLLTEMEEFMPLGWRKLPRSLIRWIFQDLRYGVDEVPKLLEVPKRAWWSVPLFSAVRAANRLTWVPNPVQPLVRRLARKAGRHVVVAYADKYSEGPPPFEIPPDVAHGWRVRQGPTAHRVRKARGMVRHAARAPMRRRAEKRGG